MLGNVRVYIYGKDSMRERERGGKERREDVREGRGWEERKEGGRQWAGACRGLQPLASDRNWSVNSSQWLSL